MIDLTKEQKLLNAQCELLKREFAELFARKNDMLSFEESLLTALYLNSIGRKQYQLYCLGVEISMIKQRIYLIQAYLNRNENPDKTLIDAEINRRFVEYKQKIEAESQRLSAAVDYLKSEFLSVEESKKIREVYRIIVKRLHPDINPGITVYEKELFVKAQAAYELNDLNVLNEILLSIDLDNTDNSLIVSPILMKEFVEKMEDNVGRLKNQIEELDKRFPFNLKEQLYDEEWITLEQKKLDQKIAILLKEKGKKNEYLIMLGLWKPESLN